MPIYFAWSSFKRAGKLLKESLRSIPIVFDPTRFQVFWFCDLRVRHRPKLVSVLENLSRDMRCWYENRGQEVYVS